MNRKKLKVIIKWSLAFLLLFIVIRKSFFSNYELSAEAVFEKFEGTYHGPSELLEKVKLDDAQIFLSTYENFFSATIIKKHASFFWTFGGYKEMEIKYNQDITYSWGGTGFNEEFELMHYYGIVTNPEIKKVELDVAEGYGEYNNIPGDEIITLDYQLKDHPMFLFYWKDAENNYISIALRGLNSNGEVVYEEDLR